jgi:hypothetical protein
VASDASTANESQKALGDGSGHADAKTSELPPSNLTHELAQLLAAAIAQNQPGRGPALPTNSELTSLANMVSMAAGQRTLAPVFKDGLSALSYSRPHSVSSPPAAHGRQGEPFHADDDDEPMPIPSTWRETESREEDRWFSQQMGAALLGLVAGLMIVVPTVLWLSGWLDTSKTKGAAGVQAAAGMAPETRLAEARPASDVRTLKVQVHALDKAPEPTSPYVTGSLEPRLLPDQRRAGEPAFAAGQTRTTDVGATEPKPEARVAQAKVVEVNAAEVKVADARAVLEDMLAQAKRHVESGDIATAREILMAADDGRQGPVSFALAETFDPNMLAAWGSRGIVADVAKAKALYRKALGLGVASAQNRLDALR